jgi:hypothetical protein
MLKYVIKTLTIQNHFMMPTQDEKAVKQGADDSDTLLFEISMTPRLLKPLN